MKLTDTPDGIIHHCEQQHPGLSNIIARINERTAEYQKTTKRNIADYQAAALFALAAPYDRDDVHILEIGTAYGFSASVLAEACPKAHIQTLNIKSWEVDLARDNLSIYDNVEVFLLSSFDYLARYGGEGFDLIFVDGDHKRVTLDLPWWGHLKPGGLMLFHDYSPEGTYRECPPVYEAVNRFALALGKDGPDVLVIDDRGVGMAGFIKPVPDTEIPDNKDFQVNNAKYYSMQSREYLAHLYDYAYATRNTSGDVVECGCASGGTGALLYVAAQREKQPLKRTLWAIDTFAGVPEPDPEHDGDKAYGKWQAKQPGGWNVADPQNVYRACDLLHITELQHITGGEHLEVLQKYITDYDFEAVSSKIAILHIDVTLYRSTKVALEKFYDAVVPSGLVIVSAYRYWPGIYKAVAEFAAERGLLPTWDIVDKVNLVWRKR